MASITSRKDGIRQIQFVTPEGDRKTISLGKCSKRAAEQFARFLERLLECRRLGVVLDSETTRWLSELPTDMYARLVRLGLVPARAKTIAPALEDFLQGYLETRPDVKPASKLAWQQTMRNLVAHFGADKPIDDITPADAETFRAAILARGLSPATVAKQLSFARQFFQYGVKARLLAENPFTGVKCPKGDPKARQRYISPETTQRLIEACPNVAWRTVVALCRYGGLRCPSEVLSLKWEHVNWERGEIRVPQPKVERYGKPYRVIPIFAPLRPYLEEAWETAEPGAEYVVPFDVYRQAANHPESWLRSNMRTQFARIIRKAGCEPWPRPFHNLRASVATDLTASFPSHVVATWLGHTEAIAEAHYWQTTESHYEAARNWTPVTAAHTAAVSSRNERKQDERGESTICRNFSPCNHLRRKSLFDDNLGPERTGFEPARGWTPLRI